jgi:predicted dehydrogenase
MKNSNNLKVGIIGYGYATKTFHAPLIKETAGLELAAFSSSDASKVRADYPDAAEMTVENTPEELIARADIDLVIIPTPNQTHFPLAERALLAGKHVVVDKPVTVTSIDAHKLARLAHERGLTLSVFHNRRLDGDFLTIKRLIAENVLSRIVHFESHFDRFRPQVLSRWRESEAAGSGIWYDLGSHLLDQTVQLFGKPATIHLNQLRARDGAQSTDFFHTTLQYESPVGEPLLVILHASTLAAITGARFLLHGTTGSFQKHGLDTQEDALKGGIRPGANDWGIDSNCGTLKILKDGNLNEISVVNERGDYLKYYAQIRDAIRMQAPNPVPPEEAAFIIELIEAGEKSALEARTIEV